MNLQISFVAIGLSANRCLKILMIVAFVGLCHSPGIADEVATARDPIPTFQLDVVLLIQGEEIAGKPDLCVERNGYAYLFSSEQNRQQFLASPEQFEVQLGGACARMGSLSGRGSTQLHAVHQGKLYIFASEACRAGFLKAPERLLMTNDSPPKPEKAALEAGKMLMQKFLKSVGDEESLERTTSIRMSRQATIPSNGEQYVNREILTVRFPTGFRHDSWWNDANYAQVIDADTAQFSDRGKVRNMVNVQRRDATNAASNTYAGLVWLLRQSEVTVEALPTSILDGRPVDRLQVFANGMLRTLTLDSESGRMLQQQTRAHGPTMAVGRLTVQYSDFEDCDGLILARTETQVFDNNQDSAKTVTWEYELNVPHTTAETSDIKP